MALPGSTDPPARTLPSAWISLDDGGVMQEAQDALETYKKKDPAKGASPPSSSPYASRGVFGVLTSCSRCALPLFASLLPLCATHVPHCDINANADVSVCRPPCACARAPTVVVRFKAVGNAPIMKQNFYKITASNRFQAVIQFLRKELGWKQGDPLVSIPFPSLLSSRTPAVRARVLPALSPGTGFVFS